MNSKTVYIIGAGKPSAIEQAIKELEAKGFEPVVVESMEDVPVKDRFSCVQKVYELTTTKCLPYVPFIEDKKRKGHERPYKYHP